MISTSFSNFVPVIPYNHNPMKVVSDLSDAALNEPSILSIGNFDGLHLGHRLIVNTVVERARTLGLRSAVITFDPHPIRVLAPGKAPRLINTLQQKLALFESAGLELVFVARFDARFAALSPDDFVRQYLVQGLHAKTICVGGNFTFGCGQAGTVQTLRQWSRNFDLIEVAPVVVRRTLASSTNIRRLVQEGRVSRACRLLGRWFEIEGRIVSGDGRGRSVTVPTLNLDTENELLPDTGVYVTRAALDAGGYLDAITNIGMRPTFEGRSLTIETFILGAAVPPQVTRQRLQFLKRIRDERRFDSPALLREQITRDVRTAEKFLHRLRGAEARAAGDSPHLAGPGGVNPSYSR